MLVGALRMHERCWVGQRRVVHVAREIPQPGGFNNMWGGGAGHQVLATFVSWSTTLLPELIIRI